MERKASFSVEKPKANSSQHNDRTHKPKYLLEQSPDFKGNFYKKYGEYENDKQYIEYAQDFYKKKIGQKMQKVQYDPDHPEEQTIIKEAVISLKEEHTEKDILELFDKINAEYGGHIVLEMAIHHDEGHFENVYGDTFYPNTDIFYNKQDENWYFDKKFTDQATMMKKVYNYHAHVKYTMMDELTAKSPQMKKGDLSNRYKMVADHFKMTYAPGRTRFQKKGINQVKAEHHDNKGKVKEKIKEIKELQAENFTHKVEIGQLEEKLQAKGKVAVKDLTDLKEAYRKEMIASELYYTKEDYQALNKLFNEAKELNKTRELDLQKLQSKVDEISADKTKYRTKNTELQANLDKAEVELKEKDVQIASYETKIADLEQKSSLAAQTTPEDKNTLKTALTEDYILIKKHEEKMSKQKKAHQKEIKKLNTKYDKLKKLFDKVWELKNDLLKKLGHVKEPQEQEPTFKVYEIDGYKRVVAKSESEALSLESGTKVTSTKEISSITKSKTHEGRATVNGESLVKVSKDLDLKSLEPKVQKRTKSIDRSR